MIKGSALRKESFYSGTKGAVAVCLLLSTMALLSACTKKGGNDGAGGATGAASPPDSSVQSGSLKGKTLKIVLKDNVKTGDPAACYDTVSAEPVNQIYETPYQYDYYGKPGSVIPLAAEAMPTFSKDRKQLTFKIRKGLKFSNDPCFADGKGREVTAKDFLFSWKRHAVTATHSEGAWVFEKKVVGWEEFHEKVKDIQNIEDLMKIEVAGLKALDDYTIQMTLVEPYPQLMYLMTMNFTAVVPVEAVKKYGVDFANHPVGTGPYRVVTWSPQDRVILTKNENFHGEKFPEAKAISDRYADARGYAGRDLPLVENIEFRVIKEKQPQWLELLAGNLHHIEIPKDNITEALDPQDPRKVHPNLAAKGFDISIDDTGTISWYLFINMADATLGQNKLLRQAISLAIDPKRWLELYRNGRGVVSYEVNSKGMSDQCGKTAKKYDFNPAKARELLAKAGFPGGKDLPVIRLDMRGSETVSRQIGEFIEKSLREVGIKVELTLNTFPAFLDKRNKKNLQLAYGGWIADHLDSENFLQLYYGPFEAPGPNESNFKNAEYDALYNKMKVMDSGPQRRAIICKMEDILQEEVPVVYGIHEYLYRLYPKKLKNFHNTDFIWNKYKYLDLE